MNPKIQIMKTRPEVTDEEIRSHMDFEKILRDAKTETGSKTFSRTTTILGITGTAMVALTAYYFQFYQRPEAIRSGVSQLPASSEVQQQEIIKAVTDSVNKTSDIKKEVSPESRTSANARQTGIDVNVVKEKDSIKNSVPFVYSEAEPVNGFPHLYEYFNSSLKYPDPARKDSLQGIVTVRFVIGKEGKSEDIVILNSLGPEFDAEAIRLIENMPAWKPATINGKAVASKISLPLTFRIERIKK